MSRFAAFLKELRRRRVFRTAGLYIVGAWILLQIADLAFNAWGISGQALRYVFVGAVVGFPLAILFGWLYDITPQGIVRNKRAEADRSDDLRLRTSDFVILASLIVVAGSGIYGISQRIPESGTIVESSLNHAGDIPPQSVAVLPFANMSAANENAAFLAHGIHSDLLTLLSKVHDIKIISKTSVDRYRASEKSVPQIGQELRVATVMEGDVQRAGVNLQRWAMSGVMWNRLFVIWRI